jgi:hypothetical protein
VLLIVLMINCFSKFDEDTHLAIALSVTDSCTTKSGGDSYSKDLVVLPAECMDFKQDAFAALMSSKILGEAATTGAKRSKKKLL